MTLPIVDDVISPVCAMLRTKTAFGTYVTDGDDSEWRLCVGDGRRKQRDKSEQGSGEHAHQEPPRDERRFYC